MAKGARVTPLDLYLTRAGDARAQLAASCDITDESSVAAGTIEQLARHREFRRAVDGMHRLGRVANPDEIASVTAFLASDDSAFMSGWAVIVDGGCTA
ncbi:MAG TPA: SDR family oxidoreductase [Actinomycetales bacterium]|nr:SDR family oxidoreductase [Actinomycetales bacterium]